MPTDSSTARNTLTQMMQDESLGVHHAARSERHEGWRHTGLAMFEKSASGLEVVQDGGKRKLSFFHKSDVQDGPALAEGTVELRVHVEGDAATYSYSVDEGRTFQPLGGTVPITFSWWKGSRPSLFAYTAGDAGESGHVDFDWARYRGLDAGR